MEFYTNTQILSPASGSLLWQSALLGNEYPIPDFSSLGDFGKSIARGLRSGQTIEVLQRIEIEVEVTIESRINRDYRYYLPRDYIASWIVLHNGGVVVPKADPFLFSRGRNILENWHRFTVLSDKIPSEYMHLQRQERTDLFGCNWALDPGITPSGVGGLILINSSGDEPNLIALGQDTSHWQNDDGEPYPYGEIGIPGGYQSFTQVEGLWYEIGFYFYEGCQPISIRESLSIPALQQIVIPPTKLSQVSVAPQCLGVAPPDNCADLFDQFVANQTFIVYLDEASCLLDPLGAPCAPYVWECPLDPAITVPYWLPSPE